MSSRKIEKIGSATNTLGRLVDTQGRSIDADRVAQEAIAQERLTEPPHKKKRGV